ncbi:uncharacterized protein [Physcomitrium patens]|uniref:uncharacterized protein isoform X2 n=1 Tax=Physcomitrium patens TaxID=3218 RepID=UPI000D17CBEE|nr:leucine-rich repeat extensin-like protein 5 isoform X2 [Physcomitrium patens]|eukprot:XP_024377706.1 leucine-rich repeat extensin-like protein 5 isoform X2 [Physcomitrella patens]
MDAVSMTRVRVLFVLSLLGGAFADLASQEGALLSFKNALENPTALSSWNQQLTDACSGIWRGVECDDAKASITNLTLEGGDFTGEIPNDINRMKFLSSLTIRNTAFLGAIPQAIADLRNLKTLIVANNPQLNGTFPTWVMSLKNLEQLSLAGNNLTGSIIGCNNTTQAKNFSVPVAGGVTVEVPSPYTDLVNVTLPNVPVLMFRPQNVTLPTVAIPILMFNTLPNVSAPNLTDVTITSPLVFMCPNVSIPSPSNITLHTSNWTIQPTLQPLNWTLDFPNLSPPIARVRNFTWPTLPASNKSNFTQPWIVVTATMFNWSTFAWNISEGPSIDVPGVEKPVRCVNVSVPNPFPWTSPDISKLNFTFPVFPPSQRSPWFSVINRTTFPPLPSIPWNPFKFGLSPLPQFQPPNFTFPDLPPLPQLPPLNFTLPPLPQLHPLNYTFPPLPEVVPPNITVPPLSPLPSIPPLINDPVFNISNITSFPPLPSVPQSPPLPLPNITLPTFPPLPPLNFPSSNVSRFPPIFNTTFPKFPPLSPIPGLPSVGVGVNGSVGVNTTIPSVGINGTVCANATTPPIGSPLSGTIINSTIPSLPPNFTFSNPPLPHLMAPNFTFVFPPLPHFTPPNFTFPPLNPNFTHSNFTLPPLPEYTPPNITLPSIPPLPQYTHPNYTLPTVPPSYEILPPNFTFPPLPQIVLPINLTLPPIPPFIPPNVTLPPLPTITKPNFTFYDIPPLPQYEPSNLTSPPLPELTPPNLTWPWPWSIGINLTNITIGAPFPSILPLNESIPNLPPLPSIFLPNFTVPGQSIFNFTNPYPGYKPPMPGTPPCDDIKDEKSQVLVKHNNKTRHLLELDNSHLTQGHQPQMSGLHNLKFLDLSNNAFTGKISENLNALLPNLKHVDLSNNKLEGHVPQALLKSKLKSINLANNYFSGRLPRMKTQKYDLLDVSNNCLTGILPRKSAKSSSEFYYGQKCPPNSKHCKCVHRAK